MASSSRHLCRPLSHRQLSVLEPNLCNQCLHQQSRRSINTSSRLHTRQREEMFRWLNGPGAAFKNPLPKSTNYLSAYDASGGLIRAKGQTRGDENGEAEQKAGLPRETAEDLQPFPMNQHFRSQSILSEELKDEIYKRVMEKGEDVRTVSTALGVEMRRVGAVVRLKAVEAEWIKQGKTFAMPYAKAVTAMLPQTPYIAHSPIPHEPINDLPVHSATTRQVFQPVSESRHFTRRDAATTFAPDLLPADDRIPHPQLIQEATWKKEGYRSEEIARMSKAAREQKALARQERNERNRARLERVVQRRETERWEFRFRDVSVESSGKDGRAPKGVGQRYGFPLEDRKKGQIKIPRRVG